MLPSLQQKKNLSNVSGFFGQLSRGNKISLTFFSFICALLLSVGASAQTITTGAVSPTRFCSSSATPVTVPFTCTGFTGPTAFVAVISSSSGSFSTPTFLGFLPFLDATGVANGTVAGTIPAGLTTGTQYKIRVYAINLATGILAGSNNSNGLLWMADAAPGKPHDPFGEQTDLCGDVQTTVGVSSDLGVDDTWAIPVASTHLSFASVGTNSVVLNVAAGMDHETVEVTANNGCGASPVKVINLWSQPAYPKVIGPLCATADQQYNFTVLNAQTGATYTWAVDANAQIINGQGTSSVAVIWGTTQRIDCVASNGCGTTGTARTIEPPCPAPLAGNGAAVTSTLVRVSPNPASSSAQISFTANKETKYIIELTDKTGKMLQRKELIANAGENKLTLDLGKYTNGTYFVNVMGEDRRQAAQIIKTN